MDIEQLTKAQIVLLTLLVSFITSIATGIVAVALMDQAPAGVTQTINRIVERTVERVVQQSEMGDGSASVSRGAKEVTVVVKENDLITEAIEKNSATLVRISLYDSRIDDKVGTFVGLGFFVRADGIIATDPTLLLSRGTYIIVTGKGEHYVARPVVSTVKSPVALLRLEKITGAEIFPIVVLAELNKLKLGQTIISLAGQERISVAVGVITDVETTPAGEGESAAISRIKTDISDNRVSFGSPLFNMFGEVLGMHTAAVQSQGSASYLPISAIPPVPATL